jgi:hypothetical protein
MDEIKSSSSTGKLWPKCKGRTKNERATHGFYGFVGKAFLFAHHRFKNYRDETDAAVSADGHEIQPSSSLWNHQKD